MLGNWSKNRVILVAIGGLILALLAVGLFWPKGSATNKPSLEAMTTTSATGNLGITYLPLSPRVSAYYKLGVDSGALVTQISPSSPAERAGIRVGDVILTFNGTRVEPKTPLLGMMMACHGQSRMMLELWRGGDIKVVELVHDE